MNAIFINNLIGQTGSSSTNRLWTTTNKSQGQDNWLGEQLSSTNREQQFTLFYCLLSLTLHCTILVALVEDSYTILNYTTLNYTILYTILHYTIHYFTLLYNTLLSTFIPCCLLSTFILMYAVNFHPLLYAVNFHSLLSAIDKHQHQDHGRRI